MSKKRLSSKTGVPKRTSVGSAKKRQSARTVAPRPASPVPEEVVSKAHELQELSSQPALKAAELHSSSEIAHDRSESIRRKYTAKPGQETPTVFSDEEDSSNVTEKTVLSGKPFPIVGVGASAGGFEAFTELLKHLPTNTGMAFVLVQHLDPKHRSQLSELLGRTTSLPVIEARDGLDAEPDHIYVIPANTNILLEKGRLRLVSRNEHQMPAMPIDVFFRSLAHEQQERAIGIVLSGTGTDGTLGIEAIKGEGGIIFAQSENSAKYFGMPGSAIGSGLVDFSLSPGEIAEELTRIAKHPYIGLKAGRLSSGAGAEEGLHPKVILTENEKEMGRLFALLRARTNVDFSFYKHSTLKRRIMRQMVLHKIQSLSDYVEFLSKHTEEVDKLFNDLLINVTSFFRDPKAFDLLKKKVFPRLLKVHRDDSPLRFWVCGCATGEEAYSLAISLVEFFDQTRTHRPIQIFASDVSDAGIAKARAGLYPENIIQDVSPERLRRFFVKSDGRFQVNKSIRDMVVFARQNLIMDPPFSNLDMITCRNVLIYLGPILQRKVLPMFHYALRPDAFLMLGSSETVGPATDLFSLIDKKFRLYSKKQHYIRHTFEPPRQITGTQRGKVVIASEPEPRDLRAPDLQSHVDKLLLREYSPSAVIINSEMEVLQFRGRTGDYLEHSPGAANLNLLRMVREGLVFDLRSAVTRAIKQDVHVRQNVQFKVDGHARRVTIEVAPVTLGPGSDRFFLIIFREGPGLLDIEPARLLKGSSRGRGAASESKEVARLRTELGSTRESLQTIIEEQEANNEELKSANEEIQSSNEELQSTNEELETAKEELQSTNEELTTLNEELQNRNQELSLALNDLTNLLASVNIAIVILDEDLTIRRYTPMAERLFNLIPSDVGRRLTDLSRPVLIPDLDKQIFQVISELMPVERDVQDREGRWFSLRIRPYRTRENKISGAVVMLIDIDQIKRSIDMVVSTVREPLLILGSDLHVRRANEAFYRVFNLSPAQTDGKLIYEVGEGQWNTVKIHQLIEEVLPKEREVRDFEVETSPLGMGPSKLHLNARRFYDEGWGVQLILMAFQNSKE